ncbi:MAG: DUF2806 domain-containing protein [Bacillota bacterium]|nr:DUF2806 domain-containing protein [Bacillota bacterium]
MSDTQEKKNTNALINIDGGSIAAVANNLLDKLAASVGWLATRETLKKIDQKTAREIRKVEAGKEIAISQLNAHAEYRKAIQQIDLPEEEKAILLSNVSRDFRAYYNQEAIVAEAISNLNQEARPEDVDVDWLFQFMDKARLVSDEEMQLIWGRILAGECNAPGSVPKSLLHILEQVEKSHAETFTALRSISVHVHVCYADGETEFYPFYFEAPLASRPSLPLEYFLLLVEKDLHPAAIRELISLGLVAKDKGEVPAVYPIHYYGESDEGYDPEETYMFKRPMGDLVYTQAGQALCRSIRVPKEEGFFKKVCIPFWNEEVEKEAEKQRKKYEERRKSLQEEKTAGSEE